tara:strand:- start:231 stop:824 length:594 start_codon:yes stop_codon:yes gene_type:complete
VPAFTWKKIITNDDDSDYKNSNTSVNNGNWSGTDLSITNGGTGKSSVGDARSKSGLDVNQSGHLGYNTRIKILPIDFMQDSDSTTYNYALTSAHNGGSGRIMTSSLEAIGSWNIPLGFKATKTKIYTSSNTNFSVYENSITSSSATWKGNGTANSTGGTESNHTDITASTSNYMSVRLDLTSSSYYVYGGYITIARI